MTTIANDKRIRSLFPKSLSVHFPTLLSRQALAIVVITGAAIFAYITREPIIGLAVTTYEFIVTQLGLGTILMALWLIYGPLVIAKQGVSLTKIRVWTAILLSIGIVMGILAFYEAYDGPAAWFTLHGEVTLGGSIGKIIIGSTTWLSILRLIGVLAIIVTMVAPHVVKTLFVNVSAYTYITLIIGIATTFKIARLGIVSLLLKPLYTKLHQGTDVPAQKSVLEQNINVPKVKEARIDSISSVVPTTHPKYSISSLPALPTTSGTPPIELLKGTGSSGLERSESDENTFPVSSPNAALGYSSSPAENSMDHVANSYDDDLTVNTCLLPPDDTFISQEPVKFGPFETKFNRFWHTTEEKESEPTRFSNRQANIIESTAVGNPISDMPVTSPVSKTNIGTVQDSPTHPPVDQNDPLPTWNKPPVELLGDLPEGGITEQEMSDTAETIRQTLAEYGIEIEIGQMRPGPTVTMYGLIPGWIRRYKQVKDTDELGHKKLDGSGKPIVTRVESKTRVKVDSILSREKDLALALKTPSIRIETPVMGKSLVGIEVPNPNPSVVSLRSVMESKEFEALRMKAQLPIAFGRASGGEPIVMDLAKMPHILIAGATGSGKSVCINTIVSCLIMEKTPSEMRLLLIDPKRVELTPYNGVPHLMAPVVIEVDQVVGMLKGMIREMLDRYRRMEEIGVRNIESYNKRMLADQMPHLVVAIDELADLMMAGAFDIEQSICRLAQLGRATGIHMIVATQRPSVDVVTGLIKANFPSRISFGVASQVDSRTILDSVGADKLLGRGDMLYLPLDASRPMRAQGVFISDQEIDNLVTFWQRTPRGRVPKIDLRPIESDQLEDNVNATSNSPRDELLDKAIELAQSYKKVSTSLLQRRMRIGYPRAARLMDELEEQGIVGPSDGSKSRDVIITNENGTG